MAAVVAAVIMLIGIITLLIDLRMMREARLYHRWGKRQHGAAAFSG
ncbi:hypothetical protein P4S72_15170 [Vibrio sp. PP-XX7]